MAGVEFKLQDTGRLKSLDKNEPAFFLIGAQKAGTTWLWKMLEHHPGTSLPSPKELHYFGSAELYSKGDDWYFNFFKGLDPDKVIGEASTTYFYDRVPYWHNESSLIEFDESLPPIPELISRKFPEAKFIVVLRDPVRRAISAYLHWMKKGSAPPLLGLKKTATTLPKMRIVEYGLYAKYLKFWMKHIPSDRFRIIFFEDQITKNWDQTLTDTYEYLGLDPDFKPQLPDKRVHKSWGWTRIVYNYYAGSISRRLIGPKIGRLLDRFDILAGNAIKKEDIEFLRSIYLPEREAIAKLTDHDLSCWDYGEGILRK